LILKGLVRGMEEVEEVKEGEEVKEKRVPAGAFGGSNTRNGSTRLADE
jgi:hypothetical protein